MLVTMGEQAAPITFTSGPLRGETTDFDRLLQFQDVSQTVNLNWVVFENANWGVGIFCSTNILMNNCRVRSCARGIYSTESDLRLSQCWIEDNGDEDKGGKVAGVFFSNGIFTAINTTFQNNNSYSTDGYPISGGGMCAEDSEVAITSCAFLNNSARWGGGFAALGGSVEITDTVFSENTTYRLGDDWSHGGGIGLDNATGIINRCSFSQNSGCGGGAVNMWECLEVRLLDCIFSGNSCPESEIPDSYGGGVAISSSSNIVIENSKFDGNRAQFGGSVYTDASAVVLTECRLENNYNHDDQIVHGGADLHFQSNSTVRVNRSSMDWVLYWHSDGVFENNLVAYEFESVSGSPIFRHNKALWVATGQDSTLLVANNIIGQYFWRRDSSSPVLRNNVFPGSSSIMRGPDWFAIIANTAAEVNALTGCSGNLQGDLQMDEFGLLPGSICIDAGSDEGAGEDYYSVARPIDGTLDGNALPDIGPFEFHPINIRLSGDLAFADTIVGSSLEGTLTITNVGTSPLVVSGLICPPGFSGDWSGTLRPGDSQEVVITFSPESAQEYAGTIVVVSDSPIPANNLDCSGTGIAQTRVISLQGDLAFGDLGAGSVLESSFTISNLGNSPLEVTSIACPEGFIAAWSGTVPAGGSQQVMVTFAPAEAKLYSGLIEVVSDATGGDATIGCSGNGSAPDRILSFHLMSGSPDFGDVPVGSSAECTFEIRNQGRDPVVLHGVTVPLDFVAGLVGEPVLPLTIGSGESIELLLRFEPQTIGLQNQALAAVSDASGGVTSVGCSGTGLGSSIVLTGDLAFGDVRIGESSVRTLNIANTGNSPLTVTEVLCPDGFSAVWSGTIPPGTSQDVPITFSPVTKGAHLGDIVVVGDHVEGTASISCSGVGLLVYLRVRDTDAGSVALGESTTVQVEIMNRGNAPLTVTGLLLEPYNGYPGGFSGDWSGVIPIGESAFADVTFTPSDIGWHTAEITVICDYNWGNNTGTIYGNGAAPPGESAIWVWTGGSAIDFGNVFVGASAERWFSFGNSGSRPILVTGITYPQGLTGPQWSGLLNEGESQQIMVVFTATAAGPYSETISVQSDAAYGSGEIGCVAVVVEGTTPAIQLGGDLAFGPVLTGGVSSGTLRISNIGDAVLTVTGIQYPTGFVGEDWSGIIQPGASKDLYVTFRPGEAVAFQGEIVVDSDATTGDESIACSGYGILETYFDWARRQSLDPYGDGAKYADPDRDGCINELEFFRGSSPLQKDFEPMVTVLPLEPGQQLKLRYWKSVSAGLVKESIQWSGDLVTWSAGSDLVDGRSVSFVTQQIGERSGARLLEATAIDSASGTRLFARLSIVEGLVAKWDFDGSGDDSIGPFDAVAATASYDGSGVAGNAANFDADEYVDFGDQAAFELNSHSFFAWVNLDRIDQAQCVFSLQFSGSGATKSGLAFNVTAENVLEVQQAQSDGNDWLTVTGTQALSLSEWHHVGYVKDGGSVTLYLDGVEAGSGTTKDALWIGAGSHHTGLGAGWKDFNDCYDMLWFRGRIDQAALWGRPLTPSEVSSVFHSCASGAEN
ncbi:choice-of-anchor D domain-containing protein [Haloferula sp. A504]|uniref:choice-of-anchor D domain-containing protein n=1 Tax=Haloferula sp. A504 TaxID=3373601 RepID=UPI0031C52C44|nr:choice-of-anchor D domain-containing protein [Verrucomicrobiaceae bacterium E54]